MIRGWDGKWFEGAGLHTRGVDEDGGDRKRGVEVVGRAVGSLSVRGAAVGGVSMTDLRGVFDARRLEAVRGRRALVHREVDTGFAGGLAQVGGGGV